MADMAGQQNFILKTRVDQMLEWRAIKWGLMKYVVELGFDVKGVSTIHYHNVYLVM